MLCYVCMYDHFCIRTIIQQVTTQRCFTNVRHVCVLHVVRVPAGAIPGTSKKESEHTLRK